LVPPEAVSVVEFPEQIVVGLAVKPGVGGLVHTIVRQFTTTPGVEFTAVVPPLLLTPVPIATGVKLFTLGL